MSSASIFGLPLEDLSFGSFTGDAVYLGPTFFWKIGPKTLISASWEAQVAGREIGGPSH